jgi:hypothetical protein
MIGIGHLPVGERRLIVGVVRQERLLALTPSEATTLSRHELHEALAGLTVERAAEPALTLPALTPLVGILTHSDLLRALIPTGPEAAA